MLENKMQHFRFLIKRMPRKNRKKSTGSEGRVVMGPALKVTAGVVVLLMLSACFVFGYGVFTRSAGLRINDIRVEGVSLLNREAVIKRAGIETGSNILAVNLSVARRRLQADPWIAEVRMRRELPSTIVIDVREHTPMAIVDWGDRFLINSRREVFKPVEAADSVALPVIAGVDYADLNAAGRPVSPVLNSALDAIEMVSVIGRRMPGMNISKVIADRDMGLTLYSFDGIDEVRLGFDDDHDSYLNKLRRLNHMLEHCSSRGEGGRLAAAGLEYPDRVVVKTAAGDSSAAIKKGGNHAGTGHHRRS